MYHKILFVLFLTLFCFNVYSLDVEQYDNEIENQSAVEIAKMKGALIIKIEGEGAITRTLINEQTEQTKQELKDYIDKKTNPLITNLPSILFIMVLVLIWGILKGRGKL